MTSRTLDYFMFGSLVQVAYKRLAVLLRCLLVPEIMHKGLPPQIKLEIYHKYIWKLAV
jgi:hypothetical protein